MSLEDKIDNEDETKGGLMGFVDYIGSCVLDTPELIANIYVDYLRPFLKYFNPLNTRSHLKIRSLKKIREKTEQFREGSWPGGISGAASEWDQKIYAIWSKTDWETVARCSEVQIRSESMFLSTLTSLESAVKCDSKELVLKYADLLEVYNSKDISSRNIVQSIGNLANNSPVFYSLLIFFNKYKDQDMSDIFSCLDTLPHKASQHTYTILQTIDKYIDNENIMDVCNCWKSLIPKVDTVGYYTMINDILEGYLEGNSFVPSLPSSGDLKAFAKLVPKLFENDREVKCKGFIGSVLGQLNAGKIKGYDNIERILFEQIEKFEELELKVENKNIMVHISNLTTKLRNRAYNSKILDYVDKCEDENVCFEVVGLLDDWNFSNNSIYRAVDLVAKFPDRKEIVECVKSLNALTNVSEGAVEDASEFFAKHMDSSHIYSMVKVLNSNVNKNALTDVMKVMSHYEDNNCEEICEVITENYKGHVDFSNLLMMSVCYSNLLKHNSYEEIKKSSNPKELIRQIIKADYYCLYDEIKDEELKRKCNSTDFEDVREAYSLVMQIHNGKTSDLKNEVSRGFYVELNRAISQGFAIRSKIKMLKEYCNEVKDEIKDNASELMVETNV